MKLTKLKIWCIILFGILTFSLIGYANADNWFDDFDGTELSSLWQLGLKGATSGNVFANVSNGYVETGLSGGRDWWDAGGISTSSLIPSGDVLHIMINKIGQSMSCWNYAHGGYVPCGFEFYLYNHPWANWGYRAYLTEPPSEHYGFGICATWNQGLVIAKYYYPYPTMHPDPIILYNIPSQYWGADGVWEIRKEGSDFSVWYNGALIGDVYNIPEIADKDLYFVADARRYAGWETVYVKLDNVEVITIPITVDAGMDTTIYYGYGDENAILTATASGGTSPYSYLWSNNATTQTITVNPTTTTTYTVTVTDEYNNTASDEVVVNVIDVRCGKKMNKVLICHIPPGNPGNAHTICVSYNAVATHLAHGDYLGNCGDQLVTLPKEYELHANYPNPFNSNTRIDYSLPYDSKVSLQIFDALGREVVTLVNDNQKAGYYTVDFNASNLASGIYYYRMLAGDFSAIKKMIVLK